MIIYFMQNNDTSVTLDDLAGMIKTGFDEAGRELKDFRTEVDKRFDVNALNGDLTETAASAAACGTTTALTAPTLTATPDTSVALNSSEGAVDLNWTNVTSETGYKVFRSDNNSTFTQITTPAADATSYSNTGLDDNSTYYYKVAAVYAGGDANSNIASAATPDRTAPPAPDLNVNHALNANSLDVNWNTHAYYALLDTAYVNWRFDESDGITAVDSVGSYDGTLTNSPARVAGILGNALSFDGTSNNYVTQASIPKPSLPLTVSFWAKPATSTPIGMFDTAPNAQGSAGIAARAAAIAARAFVSVLRTPLGFEPENVVRLQMIPPRGTTDIVGFYRRVVEYLASRPDVSIAGATGTPPLPALPVEAAAVRCSFPDWLAARWMSADEISGLPLSIDVFQLDLNAKF